MTTIVSMDSGPAPSSASTMCNCTSGMTRQFRFNDAQMTNLTHKAAGTFAIAPTPFHDDGRIDDKSIDRLTDFYAGVGCDGRSEEHTSELQSQSNLVCR